METSPMTLAQIHARAFQSRIRWRNGREYVACLVVIVLFSRIALIAQLPLVRLGGALIVLGTVFVGWQLYRRGSAQPVPPGSAPQSLAFHRAQLVRQRDALRSVWLWYLAPLAPGLLTIAIGRWLARPDQWPRAATTLVVSAVGFAAVLALNLWGARRLQRQIDELDALQADDPPTGN
jgi:hypothetical protein